MANQIILLVGRRNSGKTNTAKILINEYYVSRGDVSRVLIADTMDHPSYRGISQIEPGFIRAWSTGTGVYRCYGSDPEERLNAICQKDESGNYYFNNGLLVVEDSVKFFTKGQIPKFFLNFIVDTKQFNNDLILMFHAFGLIPPDLWRFANRLVIHKTNESWQFVKGRVPAAGQIEKEFLEVQNSGNNYEKRTVILD